LLSNTVLEKSKLKLIYSAADKHRYHFAIEDRIAIRIAKALNRFNGEDFLVDIQLEELENKATPVDTKSDPKSGNSDIKRSAKIDREEWVRENFMSVFPKATLTWIDE